MESILIETTHEISGKTALIEQSDKSTWLYLCSSKGIERDAFVFSSIQPNEVLDRTEIESGKPPTLINKFASPNSVIRITSSDQFELNWAPSGDSVAVMFLGEAVAMIVANEPKSFSKALVGTSGFGREWNEAIYKECFAHS
ncbi:hypothetical protein ACVFI8_17655 [Agarivorans sp. MS3-6]|uniref:hypothetical protein n=1 Tax=Agarivorans sp. TSD2052 TaxID=2937286 RepID=UPI00200CFD29|nr:hypothetical protein [Agarivorans sp. TSD2052]UPW17328.1 hypothetical protein M0C34_13885 [Agarivorans sp. TSD2052]